MYETVKIIHFIAAALSITGFILRGIWRFQNSPHLHATVTRTLPHIIDTVLLTAAITLAIMVSLNPLEHDWLLAKIIALPIYIGLGMVALKLGKTRETCLTAFVAAIAVFGYMAQVATTRSIIPF